MKTVVTISGRVLLLLLVWWALTVGDPSGTLAGMVVVALVTLISLRLFPPGVAWIHPLPLLLFVIFFMGRSVMAGIDVARRLLSPSLPVDPGYLTFYLNLPEGGPRWLLANTLSLMPGTLSVSLDGAHLLIHCLDTGEPVEADVRAMEQRVARIFGLTLADDTRRTGANQ